MKYSSAAIVVAVLALPLSVSKSETELEHWERSSTIGLGSVVGSSVQIAFPERLRGKSLDLWSPGLRYAVSTDGTVTVSAVWSGPSLSPYNCLERVFHASKSRDRMCDSFGSMTALSTSDHGGVVAFAGTLRRADAATIYGVHTASWRANGAKWRTLPLPQQSEVSKLAVDRTGKRLAIEQNGKIFAWLERWKYLVDGKLGSWSPDGTVISFVSTMGSAGLLNVTSGEVHVDGSIHPIWGLDWLPNSSLIFAITKEWWVFGVPRVRLFEVKGGRFQSGRTLAFLWPLIPRMHWFAL